MLASLHLPRLLIFRFCSWFTDPVATLSISRSCTSAFSLIGKCCLLLLITVRIFRTAVKRGSSSIRRRPFHVRYISLSLYFFWVREAPAVADVRMWISLHVLYSDLLGRAVPSTCTIHPGTSYWAADCRSSLRASDSSDDLLVRFSSFYSRLPPSWELQAAFSVTLYLALFVCFFLLTSSPTESNIWSSANHLIHLQVPREPARRALATRQYKAKG